jgi:hypothetical protein
MASGNSCFTTGSFGEREHGIQKITLCVYQTLRALLQVWRPSWCLARREDCRTGGFLLERKPTPDGRKKAADLGATLLSTQYGEHGTDGWPPSYLSSLISAPNTGPRDKLMLFCRKCNDAYISTLIRYKT